MPEKYLNTEIYHLFTKIIVPAFLAVLIKISIQIKMQKTKVTFINACLSLITGVSMAYLASGLVSSNFDKDTTPIVIALIALLSEKIGHYVIYKVNIDVFITAAIDGFFQYIINLRKK